MMKKEPQPSIVALALAKLTRSYDRVDSVERRTISELNERYGLPDSGFDRLPWSALATRSTLVTTSPGGGGYLDEVALQGYLPTLKPESTLLKLGARVIPLDKGVTVLPVGSTAFAPAWMSDELTPNAATPMTFSLVTFTPRLMLMSVNVSHQLLKQSNADAIVRAELARVSAVEMDRQGIQGDGSSGRPVGILNQPGITAFSGTSLTYPTIVSMQQSISDNNAVVDENSLGFLTTPTIAGQLKQRYTSAANLPVWQGAIAHGAIDEQDAYGTKAVPSGALIHGDFSNLLIGQWADGLEIDVDPFTNFQTGIVTIRLCMRIDFQFRTPLGFSVATGVT